MSSATDLLVVGTDPCAATGSLLDSDRFTGRVRPPEAATAAFSEQRPDCLVVCGGEIPAALAVSASSQGCPVVDCAPPTGGSTDPDELAARISDAVEDSSGTERSRITRLHAGSAALVGIDDRERLYERTVEIGSDILDFDIAVVFLREEERFRRAATTDDTVAETRDPSHGVIGQVFETGDPEVVDDIGNHEVAHTHRPEYRSGLAVPFGEEGVFVGLSRTYGAFDDTDRELAELLASHAAQVEGRLRAEEDLRSGRQTIKHLHEAAPSLIDAETETKLFERTVDIAERVLDFDQSSLYVDRDGAFSVVAGRGAGKGWVPPEGSVLHRTHEDGESYLVADVPEHSAATPAYETTQSGVSVPIGEDVVFQALSTESDAFDESDLELAELLAAYASATLSRIHSEQALRESRQVIEQLHAAATGIAAADTEEAVLNRAIDAAGEVLSFKQCLISLLEGELLVPAVETIDGEEDASRPMHVSEGVVGKTYRNGESILVDELRDEDEAEPVRDTYQSVISVPVGDLGVFQAIATEPAAFDDDDQHLAELLMAHVAVELERVCAEDELRSQRDRFAALFENIPGAAIAYEMTAGKPIVRRVNGGFEETFGYTAEEVTGESLDDYVVPVESRDQANQFNARLERGERIQAEVERETATDSRHFLMQVIPLEVGKATSRGYAIYTDVTEQRQREAELRRQNERLDQFASVVSHDLRNPLNVASGYLELARESGEPEQFDRVEQALDRMDALVDELLTLARKGRDMGETQQVELDEAAEEAWRHVASGEASLDVETDHVVEADRDRLIELFENLYRNALEHAGDEPTLTVSDVRTGGDWGGFAVADDGPGLDPEIDPFEMGTTTSEDGTGFGLAIVESIAKAHGWSVTAEESEAGGARFVFQV